MNAIIAFHHADFATLRREMIDNGVHGSGATACNFIGANDGASCTGSKAGR